MRNEAILSVFIFVFILTMGTLSSLGYLFISFVTVEFNPLLWDQVSRIIYAVYFLVCFFFSLCSSTYISSDY